MSKDTPAKEDRPNEGPPNENRHEYARYRLFVDVELSQGQAILFDGAQAHYLFNVLRKGVGDRLLLFNGRDGEWGARIVEAGKKRGLATLEVLRRVQVIEPDVWLVFAPLKKAPMAYLVEKAVEMGASRLCPITTAFTNSPRLNEARLQAQIIEAAEQCERLCVPQLAPMASLSQLLATWPAERSLVFANERRAARGERALSSAPAPAAILIGPEGGFSPEEAQAIEALEQAIPISLGPRILRAETAAVAALALWQAAQGDWRAPQ